MEIITTSTRFQQWSLSSEQFKRSQWTGITSYKILYPLVFLEEKSCLILLSTTTKYSENKQLNRPFITPKTFLIFIFFPPDISNQIARLRGQPSVYARNTALP